MERVPLCVVGCGGMGQRHLLGYKKLADSGIGNIDVVAVCDLRPENAEIGAREVERLFGRRPMLFTDLDDMLRHAEIVAVDVVTDPSTHHAVATPALRAGKHALVEKPLGITIRACRAMIAAARQSGVVLATAENLRRDVPNRLARSIIDHGLLGDLFLMLHNAFGGNDEIIITPWRHMKERGAIGLDMAVHYADIVQYYLGEFDEIYGRGLVAEPVRRRRATPELDLESYRERFARMPETVEATGEDSVIALYRMKSGVMCQFTYVPAGRGGRHFDRTVHGRAATMTAPGDRNGRPVILSLPGSELRGHDILPLLPNFRLDEITERLFGARAVEYQLPFPDVDAGHLAIEMHDFGEAILKKRAPEVDGYLGMTAVAAIYAAYESAWIGRSVKMAELLDGSVRGYQAEIDEALGLAQPVLA
ncbi:MAG TPA: Gfo/Idh/MocA family oxidoreductase [Chloroflexota bacterium]|nr:Gfo/Idh/MocA family oxidoreductase [Chloroflexota bacterium]